MTTIVTRAGKGAALTWTEGDANFTNLNTDKLENVVEDTSPQLGGNLDVNAYSIVSTSNGDIAITPNGTGAVIIDGNEFPQTQGAGGEVLTADGSGLVEWKLNQTLSVQVYNADSVQINKGQPVYVFGAQGANISVKLALNTGDSTSAQTLGLANENIAAGSTGIVICQGLLQNVDTSTYTAGQALYLGNTAGAITTTKPYAPNHLVYLGFAETINAVSGRIYVRTQNGYELDEIHDANIGHNVTLNNNDLLRYNSSNSLWENRPLDIITDTTPQLGGNLDVNGNQIVSVSNGNIVIAPNGTGMTKISGLQYGEKVYSLGSTSGTITPDVSNGNVQTITLTGNLTFSAFSNPVAGQSLTLIIDTNGTGRTLTSTMLFAGADKTISATDTVDIISVFYDGTTYYASLAKGFA